MEAISLRLYSSRDVSLRRAAWLTSGEGSAEYRSGREDLVVLDGIELVLTEDVDGQVPVMCGIADTDLSMIRRILQAYGYRLARPPLWSLHDWLSALETLIPKCIALDYFIAR